jgi:hypothetical protein
MGYLCKKALGRGRVNTLPEETIRATKFPMVMPNIGMKLTSCHNYAP